MERFLANVESLNESRDLIQKKLSVDSRRLFGLKVLLIAVKEAETAKLEVGKRSVEYWRHSLDADVQKIDKDFKAIFNVWKSFIKNTDMGTTDSDDELETNIEQIQYQQLNKYTDSIVEVDQVLKSILAIRSKMRHAAVILGEGLQEVNLLIFLLLLLQMLLFYCQCSYIWW